MLDFKEIKELEKRYEEYMALKLEEPKKTAFKNIRYLKYILFALIVILILVLLFVFFSNQKENIQKTTSEDKSIKTITQEAKNKYENEKKQDEIVDKIVKKIEEKIISTDENLNNKATSKQDTKKVAVKQGWLKLNYIEPSAYYPVAETKKVISEIPVAKVENLNLEVEKQVAKPQANIKIQVSDDKPKSLEEELILKFKNTRDISYALELSNINLNKKDYNEAIKWALNANEIDSDNETSWVLFAKAKYRLNQKDDALRVLKAYNKHKNSKNIEILIKNIESNRL